MATVISKVKMIIAFTVNEIISNNDDNRVIPS